jgi:arsenate reductase
MTAHWGVEDPVTVDGTETEKLAAFRLAFKILDARIKIFSSLPIASLDRIKLQRQLTEIGKAMPPSGEPSPKG